MEILVWPTTTLVVCSPGSRATDSADITAAVIAQVTPMTASVASPLHIARVLSRPGASSAWRSAPARRAPRRLYRAADRTALTPTIVPITNTSTISSGQGSVAPAPLEPDENAPNRARQNQVRERAGVVASSTRSGCRRGADQQHRGQPRRPPTRDPRHRTRCEARPRPAPSRRARSPRPTVVWKPLRGEVEEQRRVPRELAEHHVCVCRGATPNSSPITGSDAASASRLVEPIALSSWCASRIR